jgi:FAD/FMN-containing dehydrogenase
MANTLQQPSYRSVFEDDIIALRELLSHSQAKVLTPQDSGYNASIARWSRAAEKPVGVSIVPTTPEEVAIAVKYAIDHDLDVAVKGGGHSTAGASSTHGGLLIDLRSGMNGVRVDADEKLIYAQGGAIWGDVDSEAWKYGLATAGGSGV